MIYIDKELAAPLYEQIYTQVKGDILSGTLTQGALLPGIRTLSKTLGVARNTVDKAYTQLAVEGYIYAQTGAGFVVESPHNHSKAGALQKVSAVASDNPQHEVQPVKVLYDFQYGSFPAECFPRATWKKHMLDALLSCDPLHMTQYHDKQGHAALRQELQKHLYHTRGASCTEEQIVIGCGLHYSLDIVCKLLGDDKRIAIEEPGYSGAREVFQNNGIELQSIPSKKDGLDFTQLKSLQVRAAYVTPSHQFPFGTVLSISKRQELLEWAAENDAYIIEDDYDSEYRYDANPIPSLQSIDQSDRVIYIGTFSKSLSPSLRVNYMVLPNRLLSVYHQLFSTYNSPVAWLLQETLANFLRSGDYARHVKRMCAAYRKRHDIFLHELSAQLGQTVVVHGKGAGLHFLLELLDGSDAEHCIQKAAEAGVQVYSVKPFWGNAELCPSNLLFLGYSLLDATQIQEGIHLLKQVWYPIAGAANETMP